MWVVTKSWVSLLGWLTECHRLSYSTKTCFSSQSWNLHAPRQNRWSWPPLRSPFLGLCPSFSCPGLLFLLSTSTYEIWLHPTFLKNFFLYIHSQVVGIWTSMWKWGKGGPCMVLEAINCRNIQLPPLRIRRQPMSALRGGDLPNPSPTNVGLVLAQVPSEGRNPYPMQL